MNFQEWEKKQGYRPENRTDAEIAEYMREVFQIQDNKTNILDILDTMLADNVDASVAANGVRQNEKACNGEKEKHKSGWISSLNNPRPNTY